MSKRGESGPDDNQGKHHDPLMSVSNQLLAEFLAYNEGSCLDDLEKTEALRLLAAIDPQTEVLYALQKLQQPGSRGLASVVLGLAVAAMEGDQELAHTLVQNNSEQLMKLCLLASSIDMMS